MNREIKFRAWDKRFNLMLYPDNFYNEYISADGKVIEIEEWSDYSGGGFHTNDVSQDYILMQYTGLKDKNGKEIYEGDILKGHYWVNGESNRIIGYVEFGYGSFVLYGVRKYKGLIKMPDSSFEIIGNIYEHSHLLEREELRTE